MKGKSWNMEKIYGYNQKILDKLSKYVKAHQSEKKVDIFKSFAKKYKRKSGSVRNMYYAMAKQENNIGVKKTLSFDKKTEEEIIEKVLIAKNNGISVRKALINFANGDMKLYLRYQNKYRTILKNDKKRIDNLLLLLKEEGKIKEDFWATSEVKKRVNCSVFDKLNREIDNLINRYNLDFDTFDKKSKYSAVVFYKKLSNMLKEINATNSKDFFADFVKIESDSVS